MILLCLLVLFSSCYTGLERIKAYEGDELEITLFSLKTFSYTLSSFKVIREYVFIPLIIIILLIFLYTEYRQYYSTRSIDGKKDEALGYGIFDEISGVNEMTLETFLDLTRKGSPLCLVDGYVVDIGSFMAYHPGGSRVLRGAIGADITQQILGQRGVDGIIHAHSPVAFRKLRELVKARLQSSSSLNHDSLYDLEENAPSNGNNNKTSGLLVFREGKIVGYTDLSPAREKKSKATLRIQIALKMEALDEVSADSCTPLPSTTFAFRGIDTYGTIVERPYTPVRCFLKKSNEDNKTYALSAEEEDLKDVEGTICNIFHMFVCVCATKFILN